MFRTQPNFQFILFQGVTYIETTQWALFSFYNLKALEGGDAFQFQI